MGRNPWGKEDGVEENGIGIKGVDERVKEAGSASVTEAEEGDPDGFNWE